jgi:hypothetical protein
VAKGKMHEFRTDAFYARGAGTQGIHDFGEAERGQSNAATQRQHVNGGHIET